MTPAVFGAPKPAAQACMGGWCARRDHCPHFHAQDRREPAERLCEPGRDGAPATTQHELITPWLWNLSVLLLGRYREWFGDGPDDYVDRIAPCLKFRWGAAPHRIELTHGRVWTLFITGPRVREWGFLCPSGWVHWKVFTATDDPGAIGKGCDA